MSSSPIAASAESPAGWPPSSPPDRSGRRRFLFAILIFLVAVVTMGRLCACDFLDWDDRMTIYANARLNPPTFDTIKYYFAHSEYGLWMPGTYTVWAALAKIARLAEPDERGIALNPWVFHAFNVLLHACSTLIVFILLRLLLARLSERRHTDLAAAFGALLFAVHPVQVESVGWISGSKDVLCAFFSLIALWQYTVAAEVKSSPRYLAASIALILAMLCKPLAMVIPAMALTIDVVILRRAWKPIIARLVPWFILAIATGIVAKLVQSGEGVPQTPIYLRPLVAADAIAFYFYKLVFPWKLGVDYGRTPLAIIDHGYIRWTWLIPASLAIALTIYARRKNARLLVAAALLFVIALSPMLGFTRFLFQYYSTVTDHYLYLPMLGIALATAWLIDRFDTRITFTVASVILCILAIRSIFQEPVWQNDTALFENALWVNPNSFLAYHNLGSAIFRNGVNEEHLADLAKRVGATSQAQVNRQVSRRDFGRAADLYRRCIAAHVRVRHVDDEADGHMNLGNALLHLDQPAQALIEHQRALEIFSHRPKRNQVIIPSLKLTIAHDLFVLGRYQQSLDILDQLLAADPTNAQALQARQETLKSLQHPTTR